jgi:hypothetical protein
MKSRRAVAPNNNTRTNDTRRMVDRTEIEASMPLQLESTLSISLAPALCDAQEALQEVEKKRRKEDLAVEESVREVLAWAQVHRPRNTTRAYLPKQREWKVSSPLQFVPTPFYSLCSFMWFYC